jgi:glycosyltransferase involved in cell wall biosynthesis
MRVLMLNNEFPPLGGGTGTVNHALLERMARIPSLEIDLVTSAAGRDFESQHFSERVRIFKMPVNRRDIHHASNLELITYSNKALWHSLKLHLSRPYDLCMAWSALPAGVTALALRRLTGLRYLVRVCGPDIPGFEARYGALYPILTPVIKAVWWGAETVVAKCQGEAGLIHAVDPSVPVMQIPNGVDLAAFRKAAMSGEREPLRLLCVARLIERKGQHHLLEAIRLLEDRGVDVTLDLIGTGDALPAYKEQVQRLGITSRVRFHGYIPREVIAVHYAAADVFVLPSFNEGMSVATLEAMASGLPLVVTRTGGTADLVVENVNGLTFDWADVATLSGHLQSIARDRDLARRMGTASRLRAGMFSWESAAERYLRLFEEIVPQQMVTGFERTA